MLWGVWAEEARWLAQRARENIPIMHPISDMLRRVESWRVESGRPEWESGDLRRRGGGAAGGGEGGGPHNETTIDGRYICVSCL